MTDPKKILLVDDDFYTRDLYEEVLKEAGYKVEVAVNGKDGLSLIKEHKYDLVLLDIMMPIIDGLMVLNTLKKEGNGLNTGNIIILTNLSHDPVIRQALDLGARDFLIKSNMMPDQLVEKVNAYIGN